ncbi:Uncharacterized protein GY17_00002456 [Cryptosporidium hominis]|uniref:Uncharacterized protein n=1 Tax=Cryptosporidium hominis TaxID=237895 RepID=A0ABX5BD16_CRYHO|nr:hypothetical protein [Cryptosporidium hominis TU502]PPS93765.1 Uncharacterized protein GY17_00002456 [Cryptosporidium hominis]|eukprot:PPS93765.1 Uncharacterized protein GY17_00002456 [Cryptosporidium hominis]
MNILILEVTKNVMKRTTKVNAINKGHKFVYLGSDKLEQSNKELPILSNKCTTKSIIGAVIEIKHAIRIIPISRILLSFDICANIPTENDINIRIIGTK